MILYAPAKINIGLQIIERREDGFHNLRSVMVPTGLCDLIEIRVVPGGKRDFRLTQTGISSGTSDEQNLCFAAWKAFSGKRKLPPLEMHLHKQIPVGAGLGGGSSDAATTLKGLNLLADDPLPADTLHDLATRLGSDCPFFFHGRPMMMEGRGEILSPVSLDIGHLYMVLLFPDIHISTSEAYAGIRPAIPSVHLKELLEQPLQEWRHVIGNDFERSVFERYPELELLKHGLYRSGALYSSLSGSGSSIFGLFDRDPQLPGKLAQYMIWKGPAGTGPVAT